MIRNFITTHKKFFITVVIMLAAVVGYILLRPSKAPPDLPTLPFLQIPKADELNQYSMSFNVESPQIPQKLSVYEISQTSIFENQVKVIANRLGFVEAYDFEDAILGNIIYYTNETKSLRIAPKQKIIEYKQYNLSNKPFASIPNEKEVREKAISFLNQYGLVENAESLKTQKVIAQQVTIEGGDLGGEPNLVSIALTHDIDSYPIFGSSYDTGSVQVAFNSDMQVFRVYMDLPPELQKTGEYQSVSYEEITQTAGFKASLQSLDHGAIQPTEIDQDYITSVVIDKIEIGYLQEYFADQKYLQPVYHLTGKATLGDGQVVDCGFYMPAIR